MKTCRLCGVAKPFSDFHKSKSNKDRLCNHCRDCASQLSKKYRQEHADVLKENDRIRWATDPDRRSSHRVASKKYYEKNIEKIKEYSRSEQGKKIRKKAIENYVVKHPHKKQAQQIVMIEVRAGRLKKQPCHVCGAQKAEAHHDDYSKPLDVRWLCRKHHREHHTMKSD
jgi:hypothetical protein